VSDVSGPRLRAIVARRHVAVVAVAGVVVSCAPLPRAPVSRPPENAGPPAVKRPLEVLYVKAGRLFDGTGDVVREHMAIVIEGERIRSVGLEAAVPVPAGAKVIDLSRLTVLPGLIDCHTHLAKRADQWDPILEFRQTPNHAAFAAAKNAEQTLMAGFTTVRDLGSPPFLAVDLRSSIDEGYLVGPRVVASGPGISMTGGHGDLNDYAPQVRASMFPEEHDYAIADGPDQIRHVVRGQLKYGVDVIKIMASGGVLSRGDMPGAAQYTVAELRAAAEEAHAAGRKIAAHAHGTESIKNAVLAGVDSVEHGSLIDDAGIRLMREHGTWLVADIYNDDYILGKASEFGLEKEHIEKERQIGQIQRDNFAKAHRAGVKIAYGTDAGVYPHGDNAKQFFYMVAYGMTPAEAIRSASSAAADMLGRSADVGTLQPGRYADLIAVRADPLADVRALEHVDVVMKGGKIYKDDIGVKPASPPRPGGGGPS
jgi:imidazolonepropionase-like amidohydrolase